MFKFKAVLGAGALAAAIVASGPARAAVTTFAAFTPISAAKNIRFVNSGTGNPNVASSGLSGSLYSTSDATGTAKGLANTRFSFLQSPLSDFVTALPAKFELDATVTSTGANVTGTAANQSYIQTNINGFFEFTTSNAVTIYNTVYAAGTVLLRGDFTMAAINGQRASANAAFGDGFGGSLTYTSQFLDFSQTLESDFQMSLTAMAAQLLVAGNGTSGNPYKALRSFRATGSGNFGTDPAPLTSAVPEPEVWAMMLVGFGMVGLQVRRRGRQVSVAA